MKTNLNSSEAHTTVQHWLRVFLIPLLLSALAGCGVTIGAKTVKIPPSGVVPGEGIVYALPKTTFDVEQPVTLAVHGGGPLADVYDGCLAACKYNPRDIKDACAIDLQPKVKIGIPMLKSRTIPDMQQLYRVDANPQLFQTLSMKFEVEQNGVLKSADSSASNTTYEVISDIAKQAISLITRAQAMNLVQHHVNSNPDQSTLSLNLKGKDKDKDKESDRQKEKAKERELEKIRCYKTAQTIANIAQTGAWPDGENQCAVVTQVEKCLVPANGKIKQLGKELDDIYFKADPTKADADTLQGVAAFKQSRLAQAQADLVTLRDYFGLTQAKPTEATYTITIPVGTPLERQVMNVPPIRLSESVRSGAVITGTSENAGKLQGKLMANLSSDQAPDIRYEVFVAVPEPGTGNPADDANLPSNGYRYRIPLASAVSFKVFNGDKPFSGTVTENRLIAQHGAIASLPSHFKGKGGKVMVKLWPESGGIQTVEIGADALPTSAITGPVDELFAQVKARQTAAASSAAASASAAAAAAAVDTEMANLKRQAAIKELEVKIRDLDKQLGTGN